MLLLKLSMLEGRTDEHKAELIRRLTTAAELYLNAPAAATRILIYELPPTNWGAGGVTIQQRERGNQP
jgi:4-oxalocrotonate tautomerase